MAEAVARSLGLDASSAGLSASEGAPATPEALEAGASRGLDLSAHRSRPLSAELVDESDLILTMTEDHKSALLRRFPQANVRLLADHDIEDPYGSSLETYLSTLDSLSTHLHHFLATQP